MKKRTFLLFGLLAMLVLTACGGKTGAQTSTDDATDITRSRRPLRRPHSPSVSTMHKSPSRTTARLTSSWTAMQRLSQFRILWTLQTTAFMTD